MIVKEFKKQVRQFPHHTAVKTDSNSLTYLQLDQYSSQVAAAIRAGDKKSANHNGQAAGLLFEHGIHMIAGLLGALKAGKIYVPMEITYPVKRLAYMLEDSGASVILTNTEYTALAQQLAHHIPHPPDILNIENLSIGNPGPVDSDSSRGEQTAPPGGQEETGDKPAYILYTSGSPGKPKGVLQTQRNVLYFIRHWVQRFSITAADRVTLVSSLSHDGAIPDIFSSILTGACLYPYSVKTSTHPDGLNNLMNNEKITIWHSVPTLFRHTAETLTTTDRFPHVRWVVLGGEPLRPHDLELVKTYFPNATLANIYGQTESTVNSICPISRHHTFDDVFIGEPLPETGIFLVNEDGDILGDMGVGEIVVASDYIAPGYWRDEENSADVFLYDEELGKLYRTGDTGRLTSRDTIKIIGRQDRQVKIRGFRIELGEIESQLLAPDNTKEAVVIARQDHHLNGISGTNGTNGANGTGDTYLCAYITARANPTGPLDRSRLRQHLAKGLPDYMIPSCFVQLERLPLLPNGKIDREALPAPVLESGEDYKAPRGDMEKKLVTLWSRLLGIEENKIGIDDNFFLLGGHSLKATVLLSRVQEELNVKVPLSELFRNPQIRELAAYIGTNKATLHDHIQPVEQKEYYPLSAAQQRLFFLDRFDHITTSYNMPSALMAGGLIQKEKAQQAMRKLIRRHQTLRTSFQLVGTKPMQRVHRDIPFHIPEDHVSNEKEIPRKIGQFMRSFPLNNAPLLRMELLALPRHRHLILLDMHHIIMDGTSQAILVSEFCQFYAGEELPLLKIQYNDFSAWQNHPDKDSKMKAAEQYWMNIYADKQEIPRLALPIDFPRPTVFIFAGDIHSFQLSAPHTLGLKEMGSRSDVTLFMSLLTVFNILLYKYTGQEDIIVGCNVAGRTHADLQGIIGMFVNELAIRNRPSSTKSGLELLLEVKQHSVKAFENQEYQFEQLVDKLNLEKDPSGNPLFDVEFAFQNFEMSTASIAGISIRAYPHTNKTAQFDLALYAHEKEDQLYFHFRYCSKLFKKRTIAAMATHYLTLLRQVSQNHGVPLSHLEMIEPREKRQILSEFNRADEGLSPGEVYSRLFERQVQETPDRIAVKYNDQCLSYNELEERANRLANFLYHCQGVKTDHRVGIWLDRSLDSLVALLGIMKAGAAYIPFDSSYPPQRRKRIIDDAGIGILISREKYLDELTRLQWESRVLHTFILIDSDAAPHAGKGDNPAAGESVQLNATRKLWDYVVESAEDEITAGGWISGYTGQPFTRAEMDEYGDNILTKLRPLLQPHTGGHMRVLEIGCASGITMYRLAPLVHSYWGIDISAATIARNRKRVKENNLDNIVLECLPAHEIDKLSGSEFQLIIMNSVIQSFPGHLYFIEVMRKAVALLADQGKIFIGDVLDQDLQATLLEDMMEFQRANRSKGFKTKTDWSNELFLSREFFQDLVVEIPGIKGVEFSHKIYTLENELTRYRYDVLLTLDKTANLWQRSIKKHKHRYHLGHLLEFSSQGPPPVTVAPGHFAYIIYTSGTTGQPKGAVIHHAGMINHMQAKIKDLGINAGDIIAQTASACFDISVWQFLAGLVVGASTLIIDKETILEARTFLKILQRQGVTILESVPSLMTVFLDHTEKEQHHGLEQLRWMIPTGEALPVPLVKKWYQTYPHIKLLNAYGPTEASDDVTHYIVTETDPPAGQTTIPIGKPLQNLRVYILDKDSWLCPVGIRGEICVSGVGVGLGYLNNPEMTAEKFVHDL